MIQLLLFCIALGAGAYGALSGNLIGLVGATVAALLAASNGFGRFPHPTSTREELIINGRQYGWLLLALLAIFLAGLATWQAQENVYSFVSGYLWLAGIALIAISGHVHDRNLYRRHHARAAQMRQRGAPSSALEQALRPVLTLTILDWLLVSVITLFALGLRVYQLNDFLPTMHGDEGEMGLLALLALQGPASGLSPSTLPLFSTAFLDHPTLFHYMQAGALWLFGESLNGLRTLSALFGALCVPVVYAIGRIGWGRWAGVAAAWLLAVSHFHIQYSRIALNNIQSVWFTALFVLLMMVAFAKTVRVEMTEDDERDDDEEATKAWLFAPLVPYAWAGIVVGFSQYFYYGSRIIPVLAIPLVCYLLLRRRMALTQFLMLGVATVIAIAPLVSHYLRNWSAFVNRTRGVSVFTPDGMARVLGPESTWPGDLPLLFWEQVTRNLAFFANHGDKSAFYFAENPAFDPVTVALLWLGFGILLARFYRFHEFALLIWFGLGFLLAGVVTNDSPNGPRLVVITTVIYLIGSVPLQRAFNWAQQIMPTTSKVFAVVIAGAIAVVTFRTNFTAYFVTYASYTPNMMPISMAYDINTLGQDYTYYLFGAPRFYANYSVLRFISQDTERHNVNVLEDLPSLEEVSDGEKGIVVIALPHRLAELENAAMRFPGGVQEEHFNLVGGLMYVTYQVDQDVAQQMEVAQQEQERAEARHLEESVVTSRASLQPSAPLSPLEPTATPDMP